MPVTVLTAITVFCDVLLCGLSVFCSTGCHASEDCSIDTLTVRNSKHITCFFLGWGRGGEGEI